MRAFKIMLQGQDTATPPSTHSATPSTDLCSLIPRQQKPKAYESESNCLWFICKSTGLYIQKPVIKHKEVEDEPTLQSTEDAVLVIYENRKHKLNAYVDHISKLCLRHSFHAVMSYDENHRVILVTNRDSTLLDREIEVKGRNFDVTMAKKHKYNMRRTTRLDTEWHDGYADEKPEKRRPT
ncbi:21760_t:CDS:2 [Dentiscutata erythropus]|uniref:21760_t:CDS:1 n=1 Tax=Dentiscutata erythropus TaxID=1348616 RepID=A0A9N9ADE7_9GLOM|nr:21760_t:CDS:2 [Dentiscutata erythropus]